MDAPIVRINQATDQQRTCSVREIELLFAASPLYVVGKWDSYSQSAFDKRSRNLLWAAQRSDDRPGSPRFGKERAL